jgi:NADH:ubiquinone oxidoreductase subunit 6 (subunit J)
MGIAIFVYILAGVIFLRLDKNEVHRKLYHRFQQFVAAAVILFIISFLFIPYPENNMGKVENAWDAVNEITTGRFEAARDALKENEIKLLGNRDVTEATEVGYVNSLLREGVIFMFIYILAAFISWDRAVKRKEHQTSLLITGFMLYSVAEAFIPYFNKNGVFIAMLGESEKNEEKDKD